MKNLQKGFIVPLLVVIIAVLVLGGGVYYFLQKKSQPAPQQTNNFQLISDVYPLPLNLRWENASSTAINSGYGQLSGYVITAQQIAQQQSVVFQNEQNFRNYYDKKLDALGWTKDGMLDADGVLGSQWGYTKNGVSIVLSYALKPGQIISKTDEPIRWACTIAEPCTTIYSIFSGAVVGDNSASSDSSLATSSQITVSGQYTEWEYNTMFGGMLCFNVDSQDASKLPRSSTDKRYPRFCFDNQEAAKQMLNVENIVLKGKGSCELKGYAQIVISNYSVFLKEAAGWDSAKLDKVISVNKPVLTNCDQTQSTSNLQTYTNDRYSFSFKYPSEFRLIEIIKNDGADPLMVTFSRKTNSFLVTDDESRYPIPRMMQIKEQEITLKGTPITKTLYSTISNPSQYQYVGYDFRISGQSFLFASDLSPESGNIMDVIENTLSTFSRIQ